MDNRLSNLYNTFVEKKSSFKINELAKEYDVSSRTVYSDITKLNELLEASSQELLVVENGTVFYPGVSDLNYDQLLINNAVFLNNDRETRQKKLLEHTFLSEDYFTTEILMEKMDISRNTLLKDLKGLKTLLKNEGLTLESQPFKGYRILGEETKIRNVFVATLKNDPLFFELPSLAAEKTIFENIENFLDSFTQELGIVVSDDSFSRISLYFWVTQKRCSIGRNLENGTGKPACSREEQMLFEHREGLRGVLATTLSDAELIYLAHKISEASITKNKGSLWENWIPFNLMVEAFIQAVDSNLTDCYLANDAALFEGLFNHLRPAYRRALTGEDVENPMYDYVLKNHCDLHQIVKSCISDIESRLEILFTDHEISFFTLFFAASLERNETVLPSRTKVIIICSSGISTSEILKSRIGKYFFVEVLGTFGIREGSDWLQRHKADLVITTVSLKIKNVPVIHVNAFLSEEDMETLRGVLKPAYSKINIEDLMTIVKRNTALAASEENDLYAELSAYFLQLPTNMFHKKEYNPMLKEVLTTDLIRVGFHANDRDEAVRSSGELLVRNGLAQPKYIDAMLKNVEVNGTYIVIAPGIAMPHARPEEGALDIGFSITTLDEPVIFGHPQNDPVQIVIGLCAIDHQTHLTALAELVEILMETKNVTAILEAKTPETIMNLIKGDN